MFYKIIKILFKLSAKIFVRNIYFNDKNILKIKGPVLIASNHPNSFLDAIIYNVHFEQPVWSLARGDAFKAGFISKIFNGVKIMPVYRSSEGTEHLSENYKTFEACRKIFKQNGIVLIFSEGLCENEWHLRPLRKGTARLAFSTWEEGVPLTIIPAGINYSSFNRFGKNMFINFGQPITQTIKTEGSEGINFRNFNTALAAQLNQCVFEIPNTDIAMQQEMLEKKPSLFAKIILALPALLGYILNGPIYAPIKNFAEKRGRKIGFADSILIVLLTLLYPLTVLLISLIVFLITGSAYSLLLIILFPFTAWCYTRVKRQLD